MSVIAKDGASAVSVTSSAEVDLLSASGASGLGIPTAATWTLIVSTSHDVSVKIYKACGPNAGLKIVSGYTTSVTSSSPLVMQEPVESASIIRVTAQASSTTATVNADFRAVGGEG